MSVTDLDEGCDMDDLALRFEQHRDHLTRVAYRMLGSSSEAEDAVQEAWLRLARSDATAVANLGGWLTTVVARVCLDLLRSRKAHGEELVPEPVVTIVDGPEDEAVFADSVGIALLVVLETLTPAERLAFVLHDMFAVSFDEIATILDRSPDAARQLASRARRRVRGAPAPDTDLARQRELVAAFLEASRNGDFDALVEVLAPDVVFRVRGDSVPSATVHGREQAARRALARGSRLARLGRPAIVNGGAGILVGPLDDPIAVVAMTIADGLIVTVDVIVRPRLAG
jgi:RNA polymerase sigma-70 factor (ECF subfamily)